MNISAVITGDIVNSTKLKPEEEKKLIAILQKLLEPRKYEFYRGDSFQVYVKEAEKALAIVLLCRTAAISVSEAIKSDIRSSIGLGKVSLPVRKLSTAKGEAFILSGRAFDEFSKTDKRVVISIPDNKNEIYRVALTLLADHIDAIFKEMTAKQAEVILELLKGKTQQEAADKFKKSKSTISQFVSSAKWSDIEKLCNQYETIINLLK